MSTPEQNRADWLAAHPEATTVPPEQAQEQVAAHLGGAAPDPGISGDTLGAQMTAAGAHAGLPHEAVMDQLMAQIQALSQQVGTLQERDRAREQATIAALGEPILQRYANALDAYFKAYEAGHPGLGAEHFRPVRQSTAELVKATSAAIADGGNDMGRVQYHAARVDRFLTRTHKRTAPAHLAHLDMSAAEQALEYLVDEAERLTGAQYALAQ
jgi:hypothetical protein